jgi:NAD(P)-dependent dehydrogenase (short-subunit alcohol dehydrogenase family)
VDGRVALVVGGTVGIGRAAAIAFAEAGARVVVAGRREDQGRQTVELVTSAGGEAVFVSADVRDESAVERLLEATLRAYGRLDMAYNNAGAETTGDLVDQSAADFDLTFGTNVRGLFFCLKHELRHMVAQGFGAVVNAASAGSIRPVPQHALYCASKAAVVQLTRTVALEVAGSGVRVNAVSAATIDGAMLRDYMGAAGLAESDIAAGEPIGRLGRPEDVADAVVYLCSDRASYVTGTNFVVDGGFSIRS